MTDQQSGEVAGEARSGPASGFPLPPNQPGPARDVWRDHWKAELDYRRIVAEQEKLRVGITKAQVEQRKIEQQWFTESSKVAFDYARGAIGHAILINGGASIAILAHLGASPKQDATPRVPIVLLALPLQLLAIGLVRACASGAAAYISQMAFMHDRNRWGVAVRPVGIAAWSVSLVLFAGAVWITAKAIH